MGFCRIGDFVDLMGDLFAFIFLFLPPVEFASLFGLVSMVMLVVVVRAGSNTSILDDDDSDEAA